MSDDNGNGNGNGDGTSTPPAGQVTTSSQPGHTHTVHGESRAVVVGKSLTKTAGPNQVIDVLVDIAG